MPHDYPSKLISFVTQRGIAFEKWPIQGLKDFIEKYKDVPNGTVFSMMFKRANRAGHAMIFYKDRTVFTLYDSQHQINRILGTYPHIYYDVWDEMCRRQNYVSFYIMVFDDTAPIQTTRPFLGGTRKYKNKRQSKRKTSRIK